MIRLQQVKKTIALRAAVKEYLAKEYLGEYALQDHIAECIVFRCFSILMGLMFGATVINGPSLFALPGIGFLVMALRNEREIQRLRVRLVAARLTT